VLEKSLSVAAENTFTMSSVTMLQKSPSVAAKKTITMSSVTVL
jgi:hypothetical protein